MKDANRLPVTIIVPAAVRADMIAHAVAAAPRECCGLLVGDEWRVDENVRTTNLEPGTTRYVVNPAEHVALLKRLRGGPRDVIGAYHSHPRSTAWPSPSDIADAFSVHFVYVIVSLADPATPAVRAFRIDGSEVIEVTIAGQP